MRIIQATLVSQVWFGSASSNDGETEVGDKLNQLIKASANGDYRGGSNKGVLVRTPDFFDGADDNLKVKPVTFWHNDIYAPSQMYPTVDSPWCPNWGYDGFYGTDACKDHGPWEYATVAVVISAWMDQAFSDFEKIQDDDYGGGVFYASDANAVDGRCVWREKWGGYDCPGGWLDSTNGFVPDSDHFGSGFYAQGNPDNVGFNYGGGGVGCHFDKNQGAIDQVDAYSTDKGNLVQDANCQCNSAYKNNWGSWVDDWINHSQQKPEFQNRNWLGGGGNAPAWGADTAACWLNNPRDMIALQNNLFWKRSFWNNQKIPNSHWDWAQSSESRKYWGWNEVPVSKWVADNDQAWDSIIVKLPADICNNGGLYDNPTCLADYALQQLETDLDQFVQKGKLIPGSDNIGNRPGSYVLFVREYADEHEKWQRYFFCTEWHSPTGKYSIQFQNSQCWIEHGSSVSV